MLLDGALFNSQHNWFYPTANKKKSAVVVYGDGASGSTCPLLWLLLGFFVGDDAMCSKVVSLEWHQ